MCIVNVSGDLCTCAAAAALASTLAHTHTRIPARIHGRFYRPRVLKLDGNSGARGRARKNTGKRNWRGGLYSKRERERERQTHRRGCERRPP